MGLDGVQLILAIEGAFQVHISNAEACATSTVGDLYGLVLSKLREENSRRCITSAAFYRTRRAIADALDLPHKQIRPSTRLAVILPRARTRREQWLRIQANAKLRLPLLQHSGRCFAGLLATGATLMVGLGLYAHVKISHLLFLLLFGLLFGVYSLRLTPMLAVAFPHCEFTVGDLTRAVVWMNYGRLREEIGEGNRPEVWDTLCRIIVAQLGIERSLITPAASLSYDLGID